VFVQLLFNLFLRVTIHLKFDCATSETNKHQGAQTLTSFAREVGITVSEHYCELQALPIAAE
jgi:hypothetical protein